MVAIFHVKITNIETDEERIEVVYVDEVLLDDVSEKNLYKVAIDIAFRLVDKTETLDSIEMIAC